MRKITVIIRQSHFDRFRVVGTASWADFGDAWLCCHDIFHHAPARIRINKFAHEVQSFGTQLWLEGPSNIGPDAMAGSLLEGLRVRADFDRLFSMSAAVAEPLPEKHHTFCTELVDAAAELLQLRIVDCYEGVTKREASRKLKARLLSMGSSQSKAILLSWLAQGYQFGRARFPQPQNAQKAFDSLKEFFEGLPLGPRSLSFKLEEATGQVMFGAKYYQELYASCAIPHSA